MISGGGNYVARVTRDDVVELLDAEKEGSASREVLGQALRFLEDVEGDELEYELFIKNVCKDEPSWWDRHRILTRTALIFLFYALSPL